MSNNINRESRIVNVGIISIITNVLLSTFKAIVGLLSHSIAIILDAVNNLSDALSSIVTIVGAKLARKAPDKKHPYGYGRVEYISAMIVAFIILYAGFTSLVESIKKVFNPVVPDYSNIGLFIIAVAIIVKIFLGTFVKRKGKEYNSDSLMNSGDDALLDAVVGASTLVAAIIFIVTGISLEAYLGAIISIVIIKVGIEMMGRTTSQILGERVHAKVSKDVKSIVASFEDVRGVYDLVLNNYGPDTYLGSLHIEVPDRMSAIDIDHLTRKITKTVFEKTNVIITAVGIYSLNVNDSETRKIRKEIDKVLEKYSSIVQMHGFYVNKKGKDINFDLIIDFEEENKEDIYKKVVSEIEKMYPDYHVFITLDVDMSD